MLGSVLLCWGVVAGRVRLRDKRDQQQRLGLQHRLNGASRRPFAGSPFAAGDHPYSVAVDRLGRFALRGKRGRRRSGTVSAYRIGANGASAPVAGSPVPRGDQFRVRGGGPLRPVRLRGKQIRRHRLGLPHW